MAEFHIMKKITKRRVIALIRKYKILNQLKTKPYLCASVAVLSLVMLVMLFTIPDTVSAIADLCMAGAAVFAAYHAKDWLSPKINDRKFKFADELINDFCTLQQEAFDLYLYANQIINTDPEYQGDSKAFNAEWFKIINRNEVYRNNISSLSSKINRMALWGLKARKIDDFKEVILHHSNLSSEIDAALSIDIDDHDARFRNSCIYDRTLYPKYKCVAESHKNLMKHYNMLFYI